MPLTVAEFYLARGAVHAGVQLRLGERLSEWANNIPGEFTGLLILPPNRVEAQSAPIAPRAEAALRVRDVRLIRPLHEAAVAATSPHQHERMQVRVILEMEGYQVTGDLHLLDRVRWVDYLTAVRNRFLAVTSAVVLMGSEPEPVACEFLLVNAARVSALYTAA